MSMTDQSDVDRLRAELAALTEHWIKHGITPDDVRREAELLAALGNDRPRGTA